MQFPICTLIIFAIFYASQVLVSANTTYFAVDTTTEVTTSTTDVTEPENATNDMNITTNRRSGQNFNVLSIPQQVQLAGNPLLVPKTYGKCQDMDVILKIWTILSDFLKQEKKYNTLLLEIDQIQNVLSLVNKHLDKVPIAYQNLALLDHIKNLQNQLNNKKIMLTRYGTSLGKSPIFNSLFINNIKQPNCREAIIKLLQSVQMAYSDLINNPLCNGNNNGKVTNINEFSIDNDVLIPNSREIVTTELPNNNNFQDILKILSDSETSTDINIPGDTGNALPYHYQLIQQPNHFQGYFNQHTNIPSITQGIRYENVLTNDNGIRVLNQKMIDWYRDQNANIPLEIPTDNKNDELLKLNQVANVYSKPNSANKYSFNPNIYGMRYNNLNVHGFPISSVENKFVVPQYPLTYVARKLPVSLSNNYGFSENTGVNNYNYDPIIANAVTNLNKLNNVPEKYQEIELTYLLKRPKPLVYQPFYYVKYRMPYMIFMNNLRQIVSEKPTWRQNPNQLHQELISRSNVTDLSPDLKKYGKEQISQLVVDSGSLLSAKIVEDESKLHDKEIQKHKNNEQSKNIELKNTNNANKDKNVNVLITGQYNLLPTAAVDNLNGDGDSTNVYDMLGLPTHAIPNNLIQSSHLKAFNHLPLQNSDISNAPYTFSNQGKPILPMNSELFKRMTPNLVDTQGLKQYSSSFNYYNNHNVPNTAYKQQGFVYPARVNMVNKGLGNIYPMNNTEGITE